MPETSPNYRVVGEVHYVYCENGHEVDAVPTGMEILQLRHVCGTWTLAPPDGKFCQGCGSRLHPELDGVPPDSESAAGA